MDAYVNKEDKIGRVNDEKMANNQKKKDTCIGVVRGAKGAMPPQIFRKYSHFVLWEAFL